MGGESRTWDEKRVAGSPVGRWTGGGRVRSNLGTRPFVTRVPFLGLGPESCGTCADDVSFVENGEPGERSKTKYVESFILYKNTTNGANTSSLHKVTDRVLDGRVVGRLRVRGGPRRVRKDPDPVFAIWTRLSVSSVRSEKVYS